MARRSRAAGQTLVAFGVLLVVLVGLVAVTGSWRPVPGLDLSGGERLTLEAAEDVPAHELARTARAVEDRADSLDVAGAEVFARGDRQVVVQSAEPLDAQATARLQQRGRLGIRIVACSSAAPNACAGATPAEGAEDPEDAQGSEEPAGPPTSEAPDDVQGAFTWAARPPEDWARAFRDATCPTPEAPVDDPGAPLVACGADGQKYLLSPAVVDGDRVDGADALQSALAGGDWQVQLDLDSTGTRTFGELSSALLPGSRQFAVVLDGRVVTAPAMQGLVADGNPSFSGGFDQEGAEDLAGTLDRGALPVALPEEPRTTSVGPSFAGTTAATVALLVALLALLVAGAWRYRRAVLVAVAAAVAGAAASWAILTLLDNGIGLPLGLPVLAAGLVGVGLVLDSVVVFLERIRVGLRAGMSPTGAVDDAWPSTRNRRMVADGILLLVALVAGLIGTGPVRAWAIALGVVAIVDVLVLVGLVRPLLVARHDLLPPRGRAVRDSLPGDPRTWFAAAGVLAAVAVLGLVVPGLERGPDLLGGTEVVVTTDGPATDADAEQVRDALARVGGADEVRVRAIDDGVVVRTDRLDDRAAEELASAIEEVTGGQAEVAAVGPTWSTTDQVRAMVAGGVALLLVLLVGWFAAGTWKLATAGLLAVALDLLVTVGVGTLLGLSVTITTVVGLFAVLAWSIQDKVVVLGRVVEASRHRDRESWVATVRTAAAGSLPRSVATLLTVLLPVVGVLATAPLRAGSDAVDALAVLLLVGLPVASASSLFLAVPLLLRLRAGEAQLRQEEQRAATRRTRDTTRAKAPVAATKQPAPAQSSRPVRSSASAKRAQPTRQSRAKRGKR